MSSNCILAALISLISYLEVAKRVMIYKVAWSPWRYGACTKLLGISIFNPTFHRFCKWNWKAKAPRGLSALLWWVKSALMRFKRGRSLRQRLCPITRPFFFKVCVWAPNKEPSAQPPTTSTHQRPTGLALDWHAWSSLQSAEEAAKLTSAKGCYEGWLTEPR